MVAARGAPAGAGARRGPVHLGDRVLFTASLRDITERRRREVEREALLQQVQDVSRHQKVLLRDVLSSVTEGKMLLSTSPTRAAGHPEGRRHNLVTAASEAGMNAVVHGGGGRR